MLKLIFLGIGFILLFEGIIYFLLARKINIMLEIISSYDPEKIQFISSILIILGLCIIYFTFRNYETVI
mgnify:FL=1